MILPHNWFSLSMCPVEQCIQVGKKAVPLSDGFPDDLCILLSKQPWFTAFAVQAGVASEERLVCSSLIPANE